MLSGCCAYGQQYFGHRKYYRSNSRHTPQPLFLGGLNVVALPTRWQSRPAISIGLVASGPPRWLAWWLALGGALASIAVVRGHYDPDYFWHLAVGRRILDSGAIPTVDPFSFTWAGEPWIPDQWLGEVVIAALAPVAGGALLLAAFGALAAIGPVAMAAAAQRSGVRPSTIAVVLALVGSTLVPQVTARPQALSFGFAGIVIAVLMLARSHSARALWLLPPLFVVWANTHGYFLAGLASVAVYARFTLIGRTPLAGHRRAVIAVLLACVVATMVTPQGPQGLLYAASFLNTSDLGGQMISEWQPPSFHNPQFFSFLVVIGVLLSLGFLRPAPGWTRVLAICGMLAGLIASRAVGIGTVLAMPALLSTLSWRVSSEPEPNATARAWMRVGAAAAVCLVVVSGALVRGPVSIDQRRVPVSAVERLAAIDPAARVFADYGWGGYVMAELSDRGGTVFVDGRMHKYAPDVMADYLQIVRADPGWDALVEAHGVEAILLPPEATLATGPAQAAGWCEVMRERDAVLLLRACDAAGAGIDGES